MLKFFTFNNYVTIGNKRLLFPLLQNLYYNLEKSELKEYYSFSKDILSADIVIIPLDINYFFILKKEKELQAMINEAKKYAKPIWVYSSGDIGKSTNAEVFTFRLGGFNSKLDNNTFIIPAFIQDPYLAFLNRDFKAIEKEEKPTIGFIGHANGSHLKYFKEFLVFIYSNYKRIRNNNSFDFQPFFPSGKFRYDILIDLFENPEIKTDFIFRKRYRAGAKNQLEKIKTTLEFYENIDQSLYTICVRGAGNFSIRLYEVLAMGRIPVVIKSDFRLPLPFLDWASHCVFADKENIAQTLINFHNSNSSEDLIKLQESNMIFWKEKLSFEGYFREVHDLFKNDL